MDTSEKDSNSSDSSNNSPPPPPPPPPPDSSGSSPPPPPPDSSGSSPPPPPNSSNSPPPPPPKSPPPPAYSSPPPPPPPKSKSPSSPNSPPPPPSRSPPPPPGSKNHRPALSPPPPPRSSDDSSSSSGSSPSINVPVIAGVVVGVGVLLLLLIALIVACTRKKKHKRHDSSQFYADPSGKGNQNYTGQQAPWHSGGAGGGVGQHSQDMNYSGATGLSSQQWGPLMPPPPPPMLSSAEMSTAGYSSGPHGQPPLPPPHPSVALGFNKSTFTYDELAAATSGFSQAKLLGQGGFGYVHKGVLPNGKEIAVKSLKSGSGQGDREFHAEVEIISRVHHRHLVSLVGYCIAGGQRMLVYEFVPNNTLEFHLHEKGQPVMDFPTRLRIALGSAKGLAYLHEDCHPRIIHRDIKAANILIDHSFEAKVADFGLAKLSNDSNTHVSTRIMGTFGYLAPEYAASGKLTEKSDVFSFGVMLLELITGRRPIDPSGDEDSLVDWARPLLTRALEERVFDGLVDPRLENEFDPQEMIRLVACAASAIRHSAKRRPKMSQIVRALEGDVSLDDLNEGIKISRSTLHSSSAGSDFDAGMKMYIKSGLNSQEYSTSSEYAPTSGHSSAEMRSGSTRNSPGPSHF